MLPLGIEKAKELCADGVIDETMSCRTIEKIVKENTDGNASRGKSKTSTSANDANEIDENEDEVIYCDWEIIPDDIKQWFLNHFDFESFDDIRSIEIV